MNYCGEWTKASMSTNKMVFALNFPGQYKKLSSGLGEADKVAMVSPLCCARRWEGSPFHE
jgi:hypothetical protein